MSDSAMAGPVLTLRGVTRSFLQGDNTLHVLRGCDFDIYPGETAALIGPSGSGKSTLLQIAGLLERPDAGQVLLGGVDAVKQDDKGRTTLRRDTIGFVYQFHHLLPEFSALENIVLPQMIGGTKREDAAQRGRELLRQVGLTNRADHRPGQLSGGEQQRVALARALANNPRILIADEPTGNLDPATAESVFDVLRELVVSRNLAVLMATHNHSLAERLSRVVEIKDGLVAEL